MRLLGSVLDLGLARYYITTKLGSLAACEPLYGIQGPKLAKTMGALDPVLPRTIY